MTKKFLRWSMCLFAVCALALTSGCKKDKAEDSGKGEGEKTETKGASENGNSNEGSILGKVPASSEVVAYGNYRAIMESAGATISGSSVNLPSYISEMMSPNDKASINELGEAGIELSEAAIAANLNSDEITFVVKISDGDKFKAFLEENGFEKTDEDGLYCMPAYYTNKAVYLKGKYAYISEFDSDLSLSTIAGKFNSFIAEANSASVLTTAPGQYIAGANAVGIVVKNALSNNPQMQRQIPSELSWMKGVTVTAKADLAGNTCNASMKLYKSDGSEVTVSDFPAYIDYSAKVNTEALKYLSANENMVLAMAMKNVNWDKIFDMAGQNIADPQVKMSMAMVKAYLQNIDGTVAIGFGFTNGLESINQLNKGYNPMSAFDGSLVIETKSGMAASLFGEITQLLDGFSIPYNKHGETSVEIIIPGTGSFYVLADGNYIVISNTPISKSGGNQAVSALAFNKYLSGLSVVFDKDNPLMQQLGLNYSVKASIAGQSEPMHTDVSVTVQGDANGFIANVIKLAFDLKKVNRSIY